MKTVLYAFIGFLIFGFGALILGSGQTNYMNKSERATANDLGLVWILGGIGGIIGFSIGISAANDEQKEIILGIDKIENSMYKDGRFWFIISEWINPKSGKKNSIKTIKYNGEVCTLFNEKIHSRHGHNSGARDAIEKSHLIGKNEIIKELKQGNTEQLL